MNPHRIPVPYHFAGTISMSSSLLSPKLSSTWSTWCVKQTVCVCFPTPKGAESLYRNSFSFSDEKLNSPTDSPALLGPSAPARKAKLGDTKELEDFIADLDRTLASM